MRGMNQLKRFIICLVVSRILSNYSIIDIGIIISNVFEIFYFYCWSEIIYLKIINWIKRLFKYEGQAEHVENKEHVKIF